MQQAIYFVTQNNQRSELIVEERLTVVLSHMRQATLATIAAAPAVPLLAAIVKISMMVVAWLGDSGVRGDVVIIAVEELAVFTGSRYVDGGGDVMSVMIYYFYSTQGCRMCAERRAKRL